MHVDTPVFLLSAEWRDSPDGHELWFYGLTPDGEAVLAVVNDRPPVCFVERTTVLPADVRPLRRRPLALTTFSGAPVDALYFPGYRALREAARRIEASGVRTYEADVLPERRFLMERFVFAQARLRGEGERTGRLLRLRNPRFRAADVDPPPFRIASIDIETGVESGRLYSIAAHLSGAGEAEHRVWVVGERERRRDDPPMIELPGEAAVLRAFLDWFRASDPDLVIGWNVIGFDLAFLEKKGEALGIPLVMGRSGEIARLREKRFRSGKVVDIPGRVVIDAPAALKGAFYGFPDMRLETVAQELLGTGKAISEERDKIAEIERMYAQDRPALARYNLEDCVLVTRIVAKTGLVDLTVRRAQTSGMLMGNTGMSVAAFDQYYLPHLHRNGFVAPNAYDTRAETHVAGGLVMEPKPGIHDHVVVLDFKSLYPSIIQTWKVEPLARLRADADPVETPDGYRFSRMHNVLPDLISRLMARRAEARREGDPYLAQALKIQMNSLYGVMGSAGCRFYHPDLPSAITGAGQWLLRGCRTFLEERGFAVLYGDTDSVFVQLPSDAAADAPATGRALAEELNRYWRERLAEAGVESYLEMEYEKHYRRLVLPRSRMGSAGARKRYAGLLALREGEERLEFVGMEFVRSDWTPLARRFQYELYDRFLHDRDVAEWCRNLVADLLAGRLDAELVYRKRLRKDPGEYTRNVSPQVRAARLLERPGREVAYLMTKRGPIPLEQHPADIDYRHYVEKQLRPIADSLLNLAGESFDGMIGPRQLSLFPLPPSV